MSDGIFKFWVGDQPGRKGLKMKFTMSHSTAWNQKLYVFAQTYAPPWKFCCAECIVSNHLSFLESWLFNILYINESV